MANDHRISKPDLTVGFLPRSTIRRPDVPVTPPRMKGGAILSPIIFGKKVTVFSTPDDLSDAELNGLVDDYI